MRRHYMRKVAHMVFVVVETIPLPTTEKKLGKMQFLEVFTS
jgi:hypothetical protein